MSQYFNDLHYSGGRYIAAQYGLWKGQLIGGPYIAGVGVLIEFPGQVQLLDGYVFDPFNANAPITIGIGAQAETVTPTVVSYSNAPTGYGGPQQAAYLSVTTANAHGQGDPVTSGTFGLQEAINDCAAQGGGIVTVDTEWFGAGGTSTILAAATVPAGVFIENTVAGTLSATGAGGITAAYTATGAIALQPGTISLGGASAQAYTLAAPTAAQNGLTMRFVIITAHAHTLTTPANKINGAYDTVTFAAVGDSITLQASGTVWYRIAGAGTNTLSEV